MLVHDIALTLVEGVGSKAAIRLVDEFGSAEAVLSTGKSELENAGAGKRIVASLIMGAPMQAAQNILEHCERSDIKILVRGEENYPPMLAQCPDAPHILYVRGGLDMSAGRFLAVVGTRKASAEGVRSTEKLVNDFGAAYSDAVIVSGLAFGIDKAAHTAALSAGVPTIAVMAGWVDDIVPHSHFYVARRILQQGGAVISDMPPGTMINKGSFLSRNRIIAGISHATVVVESAAKGGSLITADIASSYDREVFAMPGRGEDSNYAGTNQLIKNSVAMMYQDIGDIAHALGWERDKTVRPAPNPSNLSDRLSAVFKVMPDSGPITLDEVMNLLGISVSDAASAMIQLEVQGFIKSLPGKLYQKAKY